MTVSGPGSARTSRPLVMPVLRPTRAEKPGTERNDFDHLTAADRELIFQATGQRVAPGFDPAKETTTGFAAALAAERAAGRLRTGQDATAVFLKDLNQRYERAGAANPMTGYLDKAVEFLARSGARRIDVSA
ncbi:MAG: hypothetical protein ABW022_05745 [Actinoplanes sp.]